MKHLIFSMILFLILFPMIEIVAQKEFLPQEYHFEHDLMKQRQVQEPGDIHLDPIEMIPLEPSEFSIQNSGNWGYNFLEIDTYEDDIKQRAKRPVVVFVFDTGGDYDHPALNQVEWQEKHRVFTGENPADGNGHSTHVASTIAGTRQGLRVGIAEPLVEAGKIRLVAYKVLRNSGSGFISDIVRAIKIANEEAKTLIADGNFVIYNFSLGAQASIASLDNELKISEDLGVLVVCAAGNNGQEKIGSPANGPSAHSIAALDRNGARASFSNYGPEQYASAPGVRVYGAWPGGDYREISGTSMATPHVSGIAAMIASINPDATARQISHFMRRHITDIATEGWDKFTGWGLPKASSWISGDPSLEKDESNGNPNTPNPDPDPPVDPEPDEPIKTRKIVHIIPEIQLNWKPIDESEWRQALLEIRVKVKSKLDVERANRLIRIQAIEYFYHNGILVPANYDMHEAAAWSAHFFEEHLSKMKISAEVEDLEVYKGTVRVEVDRASKFGQGIKKIFKPELRSLKIK